MTIFDTQFGYFFQYQRLEYYLWGQTEAVVYSKALFSIKIDGISLWLLNLKEEIAYETIVSVGILGPGMIGLVLTSASR